MKRKPRLREQKSPSRNYSEGAKHERRNAGFQPARSAGFQPASTAHRFGERRRGNWQAGKPADRTGWKPAFRHGKRAAV